MAVTQVRWSNQIKDVSVTRAKLVADFLNGSDLDITNGANNAVITGLWAPTNAHDAVNKEYVDGLAQGLNVKDSVIAMSDTDVALSNTTTIDGVAMADGDRVLLTGQTTASENGIWIVRSGAWERPTDFDTGDAVASAFLFVEEGTSYADTGWVCTNDQGSDIVDTDNLAFAKFSTAGVIVAWAGLTKTGNTLDVGAWDGITVNADSIEVNADVITGWDVAAVAVSANGVGLDVNDLNGDHLGIDRNPTNYTPDASIAEAANVDDLSAHLKGIDDALAAAVSKLTHYSNELPTVTDGTAAVSALIHLGTHATDKVTNVEVYLNGIAQAPWAANDYTLDASTGVITFTSNLATGDVVLVNYDSQDA